jgi:hypothetical protein
MLCPYETFGGFRNIVQYYQLKAAPFAQGETNFGLTDPSGMCECLFTLLRSNSPVTLKQLDIAGSLESRRFGVVL